MQLVIYIEKLPAIENMFIKRLITYLASQHPTSEFIFIATRKDKEINESNIRSLAVAPVISNWFSKTWWLNLKLPFILKKYQANIFISNRDCATSTPQCLIIKNPKNEKRLSRLCLKARSVVCLSNYDKNGILKSWNGGFQKVKLVPLTVDENFKPLNDAEKKQVKESQTSGQEYFFYNGELNFDQDIIDLLKAFSIFKKMQQSNMKLVLAGNAGNNYKRLIENLKTYKYRDDVIIKYPVSENELVSFLASSYALLLPPNGRKEIKFLEAAQVGTPVISTEDLQEIAGDAVLYFNSSDHSDLAKQMMYLYKDEDMRNELIRKSKHVAAGYSISNSAKLLWQAIEDALK